VESIKVQSSGKLNNVHFLGKSSLPSITMKLCVFKGFQLHSTGLGQNRGAIKAKMDRRDFLILPLAGKRL
jgi:hypothetical protein